MGYKGHIPTVHRGTVSVPLDIGPGVVYWVNVAMSAAGGLLRLRDGRQVTSEIIATLRELVHGGMYRKFDPPLPYKQGLYVECVTTITDFTIVHDPLEE